MKNLKLNQIIFVLAGITAFMAMANLAAVAEGVNVALDPIDLAGQTALLVIIGVVVKLIGIYARR